MPNIGAVQPCIYPGCDGEMVLQKKGPEPGFPPQRVRAGEEYPGIPRLQAWTCRMNPLHVEVVGWGRRRTKKCTFSGCNGAMVYSNEGRVYIPDATKPPGHEYPIIRAESGFVCLENTTEHFESDRRA